MKKDQLSDTSRFLINSTFILANVAALSTCVAPSTPPSEIPSGNSPNVSENIPLPATDVVHQISSGISIEDVDTFMDYCNNCAEIGVTKDKVDGVTFGDIKLIHAAGTDGDYFFRSKAGGQIEPLDWPITADNNVQLHQVPDGTQPITEIKNYFAWDPDIRDPQGNIIVTVIDYDEAGNKNVKYYSTSEQTLYKNASWQLDGNDPHPTNTPGISVLNTATATATEAPTFTPSSTPEPTRTPEKSYVCPVNPEFSGMSNISFENDIATGKLAEWVLKQPASQGPIASNPANINHTFYTLNSSGQSYVASEAVDNPGWTMKSSKVFGVCNISPEELGFPEKAEAGGKLIISIVQDKNDKRMVQFTFATKHRALELFQTGWLTDPADAIIATDDATSYEDAQFIAPGAKPGGPDDLRVMQDCDTFFAAQGTSRSNVLATFKEIANTDVFSDQTIDLYKTTIFYTSIGINYNF